MDFIYLVFIVVLVVLLAKKSSTSNSDEQYSKGYKDGYKALGAKVTELLKSPKFDKEAIRHAINNNESSPSAVASDINVNVEPTVEEPIKVVQPQSSSHRNLNIMLYLASFLLVSAGAAFISTEMPDAIRLIGVWVITFAFYCAGLVLHERVAYLRPAALAFTGTGLALIPFAGIALYSFGGVDGSVAWLFSSVTGVILYFVAALRLQNSVVSYLTMAFILSLVSSSVETLSMPILWQFVSMIVVALGASIMAFLKPAWLPLIFRDPIEKTGQYLTPVALGASLLVPYHQVTLLGYEIIFGVAAAHYLIAWLQRREIVYEYAARAVLHVWLLVIAWDLSRGSITAFGLFFLSLAVFQMVYSLFVWPRPREEGWLIGALVFQFFSVSFWTDVNTYMILYSVSFAVLAVSSFIIMAVTKKLYFIISFIFATIALPFAIRQAIIPTPDVAWVVLWFVMLGAIVVALSLWLKAMQAYSKALAVSFVSYGVMALVVSMVAGANIAALFLFVLALLGGIASYAFKLPWLVAGTVLCIWIALMRVGLEFGGDQGWTIMATVWSTAGVSYLASWLMIERRDLKRQRVLLIAAWFIAGCGITGYFTDPVLKFAAVWTLVALAVTAVVEGYLRGNKIMIETAIYVGTFSLQYLFAVALPDVSAVIYAHWWAAVIAAVALWRQQWLPRLAIAMGIITYVTAGYAFSYGDEYALLFLGEHVALVALGVHLNRDWVIWWGIVASALAVLYFLRDIAFLAFAFLGLLLIGLAMWRLGRMSKK